MDRMFVVWNVFSPRDGLTQDDFGFRMTNSSTSDNSMPPLESATGTYSLVMRLCPPLGSVGSMEATC